MTLNERFQRGIAKFGEANAGVLARHLASRATPEIAVALLMPHADLVAHETARLFGQHARSLGFSMPYQYAWHLVARDEEELRDWQMEALEREGDSLGDRQGILALNQITRDKLGYGYRG